MPDNQLGHTRSDDTGVLPVGFRLAGRYRIVRHLAAGGFGITYLAEHEALKKSFAIKEHFPREFASRDGSSVRPNTADTNIFGWALKRFAEEAEKLARFKDPAIVSVADVFQANGTAYMVMEFEPGQTMSKWLDGLGRRPSQAELDQIAGPLLDALEVMHRANFLHRDIAPDNIIVRPDGTPCLIDFGAARQAMGQQTKTLTAMIKAGYSPIEQYDTDGVQDQGPWTDIYALAATFYRAVRGSRPPEAPGRLIRDTCTPAGPSPGGYRPSFQSAIDAGLGVLPQSRPQSVAAWRPLLIGGATTPPQPDPTEPREPPPLPRFPSSGRSHTLDPRLVGPSVASSHQPAFAFHQPVAAPHHVPHPTQDFGRVQHPSRRRSGVWIAGALVIAFGAAILGAVWQFMQPTAEQLAAQKQLQLNALREQERQARHAAAASEWARIKETSDERVLERFISAHSDAPVAAEASIRLGSLREQAAARLRSRQPHVLSAAEERALKTKDEFQECDACPRMIVIPAGRFRMGSPPDEKDRQSREGPVHEVTISAPFAVGKFTVTFAEWDACVRDGGCQINPNPSDSGWGRGTRPAMNVSWDDAKAYAAWLSKKSGKDYRLLSEAEWEYAARANTTTPFWWGNDAGTNRANCNGCGSLWDNRQTAPVGSFPANAFGLHDMTGNVWQWVEDCEHDSYIGAPINGKAWTTSCKEDRRIIRGSSWFDYRPPFLRSAVRLHESPAYRGRDAGFRVARTLDLATEALPQPRQTSITPRQAFIAPAVPRPLTFAEERGLRPKDEFQECAQCPRMVVLPTGEFLIGSTADEIAAAKRDDPDWTHYYVREAPQRTIRMRTPISVGKFEVTFNEWEACVADGGCQSNRSPSDQGWGRGTRPVINVSWHDAKEYVEWLSRKTGKSYRLLSEAEWEYAARAGTRTQYHTGQTISTTQANLAGSQTMTVGAFLANGFGLHDMHGNVWEWVEDCLSQDHTGTPTDASAVVSGTCDQRSLRGGSWTDKTIRSRSALRGTNSSTLQSQSTGFRIARSLEPISVRPTPEQRQDRSLLLSGRVLTSSEERTLKPKDEFQECAQCPRMVVVPAGRFNMGSPSEEQFGAAWERPVHEVTIRQPFAVGKFEVTFSEWDACVADNGCQSNRSPNDQGWGRSTRPVINVSWSDAKDYVAWLSRKTGKSYRLLSEAEWEYSARATTTTRFWWGNEASHEFANYGSDNCCSGLAQGRDQWVNTAPVGQFPANAFGLHDMHGNVWEWVEDCWHDGYNGAPIDGSAWITACANAVDRIFRGGTWISPTSDLRSAGHYRNNSSSRNYDTGFRVARTLTP